MDLGKRVRKARVNIRLDTIEPRSHWFEVSALTIVPSLPPKRPV